MAPKDIPTKTELPSPEKNPAPTPMVPAADESKQIEAMQPPTKKRSASCRGEDGEDDEDGEECAAATKLRRGEDGEEGQTRIVTTTCYDPRVDPDQIEEKYIRGKWVFSRRLGPQIW